ncbi:MAG: hypothetical protein KDI82_11145 [Gammaproteobacteria bacterium]|nr:hypothetical protein [Gammaproteobacteria bacterium]
MNQPGRSCPLRYRHGAAAIAAAAETMTDTLYLAGGLYGNTLALDALLAMTAREPGPARLCFNGDFNWFNVDDAGFRDINTRVLEHDAILGNVEAELPSNGGDAGCGCAYPDDVDDATVERSNLIHARLRETAARHPDLLARLAQLPLVARYRVGDLRIGVVHGDADSLAGWDFDIARLADRRHRDGLGDRFAAARVDLFASSHTCLPVCRQLAQGHVVINNGSAGMPNFSGTHFGVVTRIATRPSPHEALYGLVHGGVHIDALPVRYDQAAWLDAFLACWPPGSPAHVSYFERMRNGPDHSVRQAAPTSCV